MDAVIIDAFEAQRPRLKRLAYRMLGSVAEAQDAVQDAWLRWTKAAVGVTDPAAWLVRVTTRLCIDRLRAAKAEREAYRGPWLPEPLIEPMTQDPVERAEDVSVAFLLALERLSPLEGGDGPSLVVCVEQREPLRARVVRDDRHARQRVDERAERQERRR